MNINAKNAGSSSRSLSMETKSPPAPIANLRRQKKRSRLSLPAGDHPEEDAGPPAITSLEGYNL